jgi:hypothetical protein
VSANPLEAAAGLLLLFFVPGYAVARAVFPEWRVRGPEAVLRILELLSLGLVLSVTLSVLVGYGLLVGGPVGFAASWSDPVLEAILAGVAAVAFAAGWMRGAYRRTPPPSRAVGDDLGEEGPWQLSRELDRLDREERRLRHRLRTAPVSATDRSELEGRLEEIREAREGLQSAREAAYAR